MITSTLSASASRPSATKVHRIILAASIGNSLEWFDLVVYGFFAVTIARLFFPARTEAISLMLTLGTFGISYLMRPLGGLALGSLADRAGGFARFVITWLIDASGNRLAPGFYLMFCAGASLHALYAVRAKLKIR